LVKKLQTLHHSHSQTLYVGLHKRTGGNSRVTAFPSGLLATSYRLAHSSPLFSSKLNCSNIITVIQIISP
jgi:hypothetical protein